MNPAEVLHQRLADGALVVLDGGMGTELQARGVPMDSHAWSALANEAHHDVVRAVHEEFVRAGADVIITNTYSAARPPLAAAGLGDQTELINRRAVEAARAARDHAADTPVAVAGSLSHVQMGASPREWPTDGSHLLDVFREQAGILAAAGADLLVVEMANEVAWVLPAIAAASETGLPVWLGLSAAAGTSDPLLARGRAGATFAELSAELVGAPVDAVLVMHTDLDQVAEALDTVFADWTVPIGVYPNSGTFTPPQWVFGDVSPDRLAAEARTWARRGVQIIGGCCGTGPEHIAAVRGALVDC